jgi:hypothetical protein
MTETFVPIMMLIIISLIVFLAIWWNFFRRVMLAYAVLSIYRMLSWTFIPTNQLADDILKRAFETFSIRMAFRMHAIGHAKILIILDALAMFGLAEYGAQPNQEIEQMKKIIFQKIDTLVASGLDNIDSTAIRALENNTKALSMIELAWRKKYRGDIPEPRLSDFILKHG